MGWSALLMILLLFLTKKPQFLMELTTPRSYIIIIVGTLIQSSQCTAGTKSSVLVLFFAAKMAQNASATLDLVSSGYVKDLLPTILLWNWHICRYLIHILSSQIVKISETNNRTETKKCFQGWSAHFYEC